jgi:cardiolipin synthase A/B
MDLGMVSVIILVLIILVIWLNFDYQFGRKQHVANSDPHEYPVGKGDFQRIFSHGPELFEDLFQEIKNAKKHVHVLFYIAKDDKISNEFFSILKEKAREGVEVRLMLDRIGSYKVTKQMAHELKAENIKFAFSHVPKLPFLFYSFNVRNHRKITVIDGEIGYIGGFNVGKEYIDLDPKLSPWRDYHLKLRGQVVHDLQREFLIDWAKASETELIEHKAYYPDFAEPKKGHEISIRVVSSEGAFIEGYLSKLIRGAETSIFIGTPYFIPSSLLFSDLLDALKRGVKLTLLVPLTADHILVKEASYRYLRPLLAAGAEVYQFNNGFYHAKVLFFDEGICDIGTTNFDQRSMFFNYEINCLMYDQSSVQRVKTVVEKDLKDSKKLTLAQLNQVSLWTKTKETIAKPIEKFL